MFDFERRLSSLREAMQSEGMAAALIAATDNMRYLTGWAEPAGERFLALWVPVVGNPVFLVPQLYADDVLARRCADIPVLVHADGDGWHDLAARCLAGLAAGAAVLVDDELQAGHLLDLQRLGPSCKWIASSTVMPRLRALKSPDEIQAMERSASLADTVFLSVLDDLRPGTTEAGVQTAILRRFADGGAESSWAIVAFGPNSALPHHRSGGKPLEPGAVAVLDLGCSLDGYQSDITRTVAIGRADPDAARIYDVVLAAHEAAMSHARPGVACQQVDRAARRIISEAGHGPQFVHRTGHGIGLSTHEPPNLVEGDLTVLAPGMCFSDEPGIYLPGRFGVRIENIICITEDGARSLNAPAPTTLPVLER